MTTLALTSRAPNGFLTFNGIFSIVKHMVNIHTQRRALANLDSAALADIGLTRAQVATELNRSFWDI